MSVDERLRVVVRGPRTDVVFDHPPLNIYDVAMRDELCDALTGVIADARVRALVFRAAGDHFSAGADLREFGTAPSLFAMRDARWGRDVWGLLQAVEVPMITAVHGYTVGFGYELALHCDFRIAADDTVVALPEARIGMIPAGGATQTLPRLVGAGVALRAVLSAEHVGAPEGLAAGLVDDVVPRASLDERVDALVERLVAAPPDALRAARALVRSARDLPAEVGLRREAVLARLLTGRD